MKLLRTARCLINLCTCIDEFRAAIRWRSEYHGRRYMTWEFTSRAESHIFMAGYWQRQWVKLMESGVAV